MTAQEKQKIVMDLPHHRVNEESHRTLHNWIDRFQLQCAPKNTFGYFGSLWFAGLVVGSFTLPRLSDNFGRKKFVIFGAILHIFSTLVILITTSFNTALTMTFFAGIAMAGRVFVGYVWMTENMPAEKVPMATAALFAGDSSNLVWVSLYFQYVSKNWTYIYGIPIFVLSANILYFLFCEPDSPKYYFGKGDLVNAKKVLEHIARANGVKKEIIFISTEKEGNNVQMASINSSDSEIKSNP